MIKKRKINRVKNFIEKIARTSIQTNDLFGVHSNDNSNIGERISIGLAPKFTFSGISTDKK